MNKLFVDDLIERLETTTCTVVNTCQQSDVLHKLDSQDLFDKFPMISFEQTNDSQFQVDTSESKFLHDSSHQGTWIIGNDEDTIAFIVNLKSHGNTLFIDSLEINTDMRGQGLGSVIVTVIESIAEYYFEYISISPFDTDAINFWEHMEYVECKNGDWSKELK